MLNFSHFHFLLSVLALSSVGAVFPMPAQGDVPPAEQLIVAAMGGDLPEAEEALARGASVNESDSNGTTALMWAVVNNHIDIVSLLLERGADVNLREHEGVTALMWAAENGRVDEAKALLAYDAAGLIDAIPTDSKTALFRAAEHGCAAIVEALIEAGANVDARDQFDRTPLIVGAWKSEVVRLLISAGANVNAASNDGHTALMVAAQVGYTETADLLLKAGADFSIRDQRGCTARRYAQRSHSDAIQRMLENVGAKR